MKNKQQLTKKDIILAKGKSKIRKELWDEWKRFVDRVYEYGNEYYTLHHILLDMISNPFKELSSLIRYQFKDMPEPKYIIEGDAAMYTIIKNYLEIAYIQIKFDSSYISNMYDRIQYRKQQLEEDYEDEEDEDYYVNPTADFYNDLPRLENLFFEEAPRYVCRGSRGRDSARCAGFLTRFSEEGERVYKDYIKEFLIEKYSNSVEFDKEGFNTFFEHAININRQSDMNNIEQYINGPACKLSEDQKQKVKSWISSEKNEFDKGRELYEYFGEDKKLDESAYDMIYLVGCCCRKPGSVLYILQNHCYHDNVKLLYKLGLAILKRNEIFINIQKQNDDRNEKVSSEGSEGR